MVVTYGAAGSVVALIVWLSYTSHVLLIGAAFGRQFEPRMRTGRSAPPATPSVVDGQRAGSA